MGVLHAPESRPGCFCDLCTISKAFAIGITLSDRVVELVISLAAKLARGVLMFRRRVARHTADCRPVDGFCRICLCLYHLFRSSLFLYAFCVPDHSLVDGLILL